MWGKAATTGVVIVHGIGSQPQSQTLRWFTESLVAWLQDWHDAHPSPRTPPDEFRVDSSRLSYGGGLVGPAQVQLHIPAFDRWPAREWVIAEAWWATRLEAPSLEQMFQWSGGHLLRAGWALLRESGDRLLLLIARARGRRRIRGRTTYFSEPGAGGALVELAGTFLLFLAYLLLFVPAVIALLVLYALSFIPVQAWQRFVLIQLIRPLIVDNLGDFEVYVTDEIQALHIRHKVEETVEWLVETAHCDRVVIVAHSQGAVVAFDALTGKHLKHLGKVKKFITLGGALNRAWLLAPECRRLQETLPDHMLWLDLWSFYDFVHGGELERDGGNPLVQPTLALRHKMHWTEAGPRSREVFNSMNVLTEHGLYFSNREQCASRLAQEIDDPDGYFVDSRFWFSDQDERTKRRRLRVTTLVGWRLAALGSFAAAVSLRWWLGRSFADVTSALKDILAFIPGTAGLLDLPIGPLRWLRSIIGDVVEPERWAAVLAALALVALAFVVAYLVLTRFVYDPWDRKEAAASVQPVLEEPHRPGILWRTAIVLFVFAALTSFLVAWTP